MTSRVKEDYRGRVLAGTLDEVTYARVCAHSQELDNVARACRDLRECVRSGNAGVAVVDAALRLAGHTIVAHKCGTPPRLIGMVIADYCGEGGAA